MNISEILARAKGLARNLAQQWLNATVHRLVWNVPMGIAIIVAVILFVLLSVYGN